MKVAVLVLTFFLSLAVSQEIPEGWQDVRFVSDSSPYKEIVDKIYANLNATEPTRRGRITNGSPATLGQFPYQIFMYTYASDGAGYICGGSIIHARWILTAAHCIQNRLKVEIFMGAINRYAQGVGAYIRRLSVTRIRSIIVHPQYNAVFTSNDVGLIELPENAPIEHNYVGTIGLPRGIDATRSLTGEIGTASGFGRVSDTAASVSPILNYARLPILDNSACLAIFGPSLILSSNVCVQSVDGGSGPMSICNGDSGGPLTVIGQGGSNIVVGISSFISASGCERGFPQVFARVSSFIPWIEATTGINFS